MGEAIVKHIQWDGLDESIIGYRYPERDIPTNSILEVGPGQVAVLYQYSENGGAAKVFPEGTRCQLETSLPVGNEKGFFRKLFSKATGTNIYQCDIYFFKTTLARDDGSRNADGSRKKFGIKWKTDSGPVQCGQVDYEYYDPNTQISYKRPMSISLRGYGTYNIAVIFDEFDDPDTIKTIIGKIMGSSKTLTTADVHDIVNPDIQNCMKNAFGNVVREVKNAGGDILNISMYYSQLTASMQACMDPILRDYGFRLKNFNFELLELPDDVIKEWESIKAKLNERQAQREAATDVNFAEILRIQREAMERRDDRFMQEKQIDVMRTAAANEGMSGTFMGAGMGLGMGVGMGGLFGAGMNNMAQGAMGGAQMGMAPMGAPQQAAPQETCPQCGAVKQPNTNFCNSCGHAFGIKCPDCGTMSPTGTKFCGNCGHAFELKCPSCGTTLPVGTKFCGNCGTKI